jgi:hypothetical protein
MDSPLLPQHDPIDSLAELVMEFVLDMDEETIPDTEVPYEKKTFSDLKLHLKAEAFNIHTNCQNINQTYSIYYFKIFQSIKAEVHSPPPKFLNNLLGEVFKNQSIDLL